MKSAWDELVFGPKKDPLDPKVFHRMALVALLAWVGLGADGLSSSCYGPEEAFRSLGAEHRHLSILLAGMMIVTISVLSASYAQIIALFPSGGGGYTVTTKLLGNVAGLVCGCALILDYLLTIAISVASGVDAIFSLFPEHATTPAKLGACAAVLLVLMTLNLRGIKESIVVLLPVFALFLITHAVAIVAGIGHHAGEIGAVFQTARQQASATVTSLGWLGFSLLALKAYTAGAGTYTGLEAVSNSVGILREPRVETARRTMFYMAVSLSFMAAGLVVGYLLLGVTHQEGRTFNAVFFDQIVQSWGLGGTGAGNVFFWVALLSEGALLFVAAQAGFVDGPRVMATMAVDRWIPTRFANLSNRLVVQDGIVFLAFGAGVFILATLGNVRTLVIVYSTCVFLTFVLSQLSMVRHGLRRPVRWRRLSISATGFLLTATILAALVVLHLLDGALLALAATLLAVMFCVTVKRHYRSVSRQLRRLEPLTEIPPPARPKPAEPPPADAPTAIVAVSQFGGMGMHLLLTIHRLFPFQYKRFVFLSVGVVDYDRFKGAEEVGALKEATEASLKKYCLAAESLGAVGEYRYSVGTDVTDELEPLAVEASRQYPRAVAFVGQLIHPDPTVWVQMLHGSLAQDLERRLVFRGLPVLILPVRLLPEPAA